MCACLLYMAYPINKTDEKSLEYTVNRSLIKIFYTIQHCRFYFGYALTKRNAKYYCDVQNGLCKLYLFVLVFLERALIFVLLYSGQMC